MKVSSVLKIIAIGLVVLCLLSVALFLAGLPLSSMALKRHLFEQNVSTIALQLHSGEDKIQLQRFLSGGMTVVADGTEWSVIPLYYSDKLRPFAFTFSRSPNASMQIEEFAALASSKRDIHTPKGYFPFNLLYVVRLNDGKIICMPMLEKHELVSNIESFGDDLAVHKEFEL